ncbi:MAG: glycerol-3-phosphate dehydrogenase/oxidase, partial [Acidimicrobiales bacterium]
MVEANEPLADASTSIGSASPARPAALGPERWRSDVDRLKGTTFDIVVVGGGIVGAGVALDAVTRGLSVGVVEAQDWASGTSSRSSKLVHGGLRYLQMRDFALVREALRERSILLRTAPHLVQPIRFLYPLRHRIWERAYVGAGIALYDLLARTQGQRPSLPRHRQLSRRRTHELVPALKGESFVGAVSYYDAQVDDARHTMSVMRTAASAGAAVVNRVKAIGLAEESSRVTGVRVRAVESGEEFTISAKVVISATGVWTEEFEGLAGRGRAMRLEPSKGVHLVLPRRCIDSDAALILQTEKSVLFV